MEGECGEAARCGDVARFGERGTRVETGDKGLPDKGLPCPAQRFSHAGSGESGAHASASSCP